VGVSNNTAPRKCNINLITRSLYQAPSCQIVATMKIWVQGQ